MHVKSYEEEDTCMSYEETPHASADYKIMRRRPRPPDMDHSS